MTLLTIALRQQNLLSGTTTIMYLTLSIQIIDNIGKYLYLFIYFTTLATRRPEKGFQVIYKILLIFVIHGGGSPCESPYIWNA